MKRGKWPSLTGGALIVVCLAGLAFWRVRAASRNRPPQEPTAEAAPAPASAPAPARPARTPRPLPAISHRDLSALDEARLMARLRSAAQSDPAQAITLAREGNQRWPHSADMPERTSILIHALAATGRSMEARGEAERMVNQAPDSPWVREIEQFTGAHRHRNVRVNDAGVIEFYDAPNK